MINICFHGIGAPGRVLEPGEARYWIRRDRFLAILDAVAGRPDVRISFDDGNDSDHSIGKPALEERGLTATFFVLGSRIGAPGALSEEQVRDLAGSGMSVGTHGMDHVPWPGLSETQRARELVQARSRIAELVGCPISQAALPLGRYDRRTLGHLRALGYQRVFTSDRRWAQQHSWLQPRFSARSDETFQGWRDEVLTRRRRLKRIELASVGMVKRLR